jgi:cell division protein FtsB
MEKYESIMKAINEQLERKDLLIDAYTHDNERLVKENETLKERVAKLEKEKALYKERFGG